MYTEQATQPSIRDVEFKEVYEATVATTVTALTDDLYVVIPQFEGDDTTVNTGNLHGPCLGWDRRSDGSYPAKNNKALIAVGDLGNYYCITWTPYA